MRILGISAFYHDSAAALIEDGEIVAIDKPAGLPVLPGAEYLENTLLWMVRRHYPDEIGGCTYRFFPTRRRPSPKNCRVGSRE